MKSENMQVLGVLGWLGGCAAGTTAAAPASEGVTRQVLQQAPLPGDDELRLMLIEYAPGVAAPAHRHPVAGTCYVLDGIAESRYEGEDLQVYRAGDSYQDYANRAHAVWRNASESEPLRFLCAAQIKPGEAFAEPIN